MKQPIFTGVATALVTPFRDGAVDLATFDRLLDAQLAAGIDALVICGTTGEGSTLSTTEQTLSPRSPPSPVSAVV